MKKAAILIALLAVVTAAAQDRNMDELWSEQTAKAALKETANVKLFRDGNYAMFIHWGLYSNLAAEWNGKTYYGISEWLMNRKMAGIPVDQYMAQAKNFNPTAFDAAAIVSLARAAGMKYIIMGSKHHEGFAMYHSKVSDFNIYDATPFKRDPIKEMSDECARQGLGFGVYYSQSQDWTAPGAHNGPATEPDGTPRDFEYYLRTKSLPQIRELMTGYGPFVLVWFDTPGGLTKERVEDIIAEVKSYQPDALISGRVGHNLGDYMTLGDMEIPLKNETGLWESVDVTNDSWGYAWYDDNWRAPKTIVCNLLSTVARGGTYMLNIGPKGDGSVPVQARESLLKAGEWVKKYSYAVYGAGASPWGRALPWGDAVVQGNKVYLLVYDWPMDGKLELYGLKTPAKTVRLMDGSSGSPLKFTRSGDWTAIDIPAGRPEPYVSVIEVDCGKAPQADQTLYLDPCCKTTLLTVFGTHDGNRYAPKRWMEKFGEWIKVFQVNDWKQGASSSWKVAVKAPGYYMVETRHAGKGRLVWKVSSAGGSVQNQIDSSHIYSDYKIGWLRFDAPGEYTVSVSLLEGDRQAASLEWITLTHVDM